MIKGILDQQFLEVINIHLYFNKIVCSYSRIKGCMNFGISLMYTIFLE